MSKTGRNKDKAESTPVSFMKHHGSGKSMSRREWMSMSVNSTAAIGLLPNLTSMMFSNTGFAQDLGCAVQETKKNPLPYLILDGAGGMNIAAGNVLMGYVQGGGQMDYARLGGVYDTMDYAKLGVLPASHPSNPANVRSDYGLQFNSLSGILRGIDSILGIPANAAIKARVDGCIFALSTGDDTGNNPLNTMYLIHKAGASGNLVGLIGNRNSTSGGNSAPAVNSIDLSLTPSVITRPEDAAALLSVGALSSTTYLGYDNDLAKTQDRIRFVMNRLGSMSTARMKDYASLDANKQIQKIIGCNQQQATDLLKKYSVAALSPANDAAITSAFGATNPNLATIMKLILDGMAGAATLVIGGCDYHDGTSTTGDAKDFSIGVMIGQAILAAANKGSSLLLNLISDGSVTSTPTGTPGTNGKAIWVSDQGRFGASLLIGYKHSFDPTKDAPFVTQRQLGNFAWAPGGGGVDVAATSFSGNPDVFTDILACNYLSACGKLGDFKKIFGRDPPAGYQKYIAFQSMV